MISIKIEDDYLKVYLGFLKFTMSLSVRKFIIKRLKSIIKLFDYILPKDDKKIAFLMFQGQENKTDAFYNYIKENHKEYKCIRISDKTKCYKDTKDLFNFYTFRALWEIYTSKYIVIAVTVFMMDYIKSKRHVGINLWHGMPIKAIGANLDITKSNYVRSRQVGKYYKTFATSDIFRVLMASSFMTECKNVYITGLPITDTIFSHKNDKKIEEIFDIKKYDKVIAYIPTFKADNRSHGKQVNHKFNNIFYFDDYEHKRFVDFIEKQNILFITKPHPFDEELYKNNPDKIPQSPNYKLLYQEFFKDNEIDLYDLFKYVDLMISDFSSTTLDYLILNRPIIYLNNLTEEYSKNRGLYLPDNYGIFMPGHKVKTYTDLEEKIKTCLYNDDTVELRERLLPLTHKYRDDKAGERIFEIMRKL